MLADLLSRVLEQNGYEVGVDQNDAPRAVHHEAIVPDRRAGPFPVEQRLGLLVRDAFRDRRPVQALDVSAPVGRADGEPVRLGSREPPAGAERTLEEELDHLPTVVAEHAHGTLVDRRVLQAPELRGAQLLGTPLELHDVTAPIVVDRDGLVGDDRGEDGTKLVRRNELVELGPLELVLAHDRQADERAGCGRVLSLAGGEHDELPVRVVAVAVVERELAGELAPDLLNVHTAGGVRGLDIGVQPRSVAREDDAPAAVRLDVGDEALGEDHAPVELVVDPVGTAPAAAALAVVTLVASLLVGGGLVGGRGGGGLLRGLVHRVRGGHRLLLFPHGGGTWLWLVEGSIGEKMFSPPSDQNGVLGKGRRTT